MVLLLQRLGYSLHHHSKLEDHHHHHHRRHDDRHRSEALLSASLDAFRSTTSNTYNQILLASNPNNKSHTAISLSWMHHCFKVLFPIINNAFQNLLIEIEHPFAKWDDASIEEYLNYTTNLLDLLNAISSSLSNLGQSRLSLSHSLALFTNSSARSLKPIEVASKSFNMDNMISGRNDEQSPVLSTKELIVHQALVAMKSVSFSACGIFLSCLSNNHDDDQVTYSSDLDSSHYKLIKEIKDVNGAVESLSAGVGMSGATEDLERKLEVLGQILDCVGQEVDDLFREVLSRRNEVLDCVRYIKQCN